MEFYEFAQRIGSVILKDGNISAFTKTLFEAIVPVNVSNDLLTSTNVEIYKAYYYGRIRITRIAKKVYSVGNPRLFELFLWRQNKNESLCEAFSDVIDDITPDNACEYIADEFFLILYDAIKPATYVSRRRGGVKLIGIKELSKYFDVTPRTVRNWIYQKQLPCIRAGRSYKFNMSEIRKWAEKNR